MNKTLSTRFFQFGYRLLRVLVIGTIISVTAFAESIRYGIYWQIPFPLPTALLYSAVFFAVYLAMGFTVDLGGPVILLLLSRTPEFESSELTLRGQEIARRAGSRSNFRFRLKKGIQTAYSTLTKKVVIDEELAAIKGQGDFILGHEITHQLPSHARTRILRLILYAAIPLGLSYYEGWLPPALLIPYTLALLVYPMKWVTHWGEYDADKGGAWLAGAENGIGTLMRLMDLHGDHESFTHPRPSKRIQRLQREFGQAH